MLKKFDLRRYIIRYTVGNLVSLSDYIPPQIKILNMVIPILMHFCLAVLSQI